MPSGFSHSRFPFFGKAFLFLDNLSWGAVVLAVLSGSDFLFLHVSVRTLSGYLSLYASCGLPYRAVRSVVVVRDVLASPPIPSFPPSLGPPFNFM